ncbi:hypothetical protein [Curtobacterium sp. MCBD17_030]|uniref:hypothetical protein n=1 Tax=Curtobacterium sp. MCBD17_030 TaxID=2175649 RepID=UPI000D8FAD78|nr:hypothetical protein [Curtobacterium sp. MCBD17_030]PYY31579.1 hypothetical protein DEI89_16685 [Curtobacterium sp. MCBD17_030]
MSEQDVTAVPNHRASTQVRVALAVSAACTGYELLAGALVEWTGLGFVPLLLVVPVYLVAILLLVWVGQQGVRTARTLAIVVGIVLAVSLPISMIVALATWD